MIFFANFKLKSDVYWKELELPRYWRPLAQPIAFAICGALIVLWGTIIVFVQGLANLENLSHTKGMLFYFLLQYY